MVPRRVKLLSVLLCAVVTTSCGMVEPKTGSSELQGAGEDDQGVPQPSIIEDEVTLEGRLVMVDSTVPVEDIKLAFNWQIDDGPYPATPTYADLGPAALEFSISASPPPPPEALTLNEVNGREGLAIARLMAYVDDGNGQLDCRLWGDCDDVYVGAAPNVVAVYVEPDVKNLSQVFERWVPGEGLQEGTGYTPKRGWQLVHVTPTGCESAPEVRAWDYISDDVEVVIIGDMLAKERCEVRSAVWPAVR